MNTLFVGQEIIHLDSVDSTNNYTTQLARQSVIHEGLVVRADFQTDGKGQRENSWSSPDGVNLLCSIYLTPHFIEAAHQFQLTQAVSLGVALTVENLSHITASIKWPNDIMVGDQKIAGILVENILKGSRVSKSIVGIGLNVNQTTFKENIKAISLKGLTGFHTPLEHVLKVLCENIEQQYLRLKKSKSSLQKEYSNRLYRRNQWTAFSIHKKSPENFQIIGVEDTGKIILKNEANVQTAFDFFEAKLIR